MCCLSLCNAAMAASGEGPVARSQVPRIIDSYHRRVWIIDSAASHTGCGLRAAGCGLRLLDSYDTCGS